MNAAPVSLSAVARLPAPGDNVAIATRRIETGTTIKLAGATCVIAHTVLEGHRFATRVILVGQPLLSWGFPFGIALSQLEAGDYAFNQSMLLALAVWPLKGARHPQKPNFSHLPAPLALH